MRSRGEWAPEGAKSPTAWLATRCRLPKAQARAQLRRGRALGHLPVAASAWAEGEIGGAHLDALAKVRTEASAEALARDEALLVHHATELRFEPFLGVLAYWGQLADPEGAEEADLARRARRDVYLAVSISGMHLGQMTLDPISGTIVGGELERLEAELFEADWAQARAALGREPHLGELARTPGQRRADALVEMATRSRTAPENGRRPEPLFSVVVGYEALHGRICELSDGTVVTPGSLLAYLEGADFERAVFRPGQTGRGLGHRPPVQRGHPPGHRATRPDLHPPLLRRARRAVPDRPHRALRPGRADHPGERPGALRVPQPPAQPTATTRRPGLAVDGQGRPGKVEIGQGRKGRRGQLGRTGSGGLQR